MLVSDPSGMNIPSAPIIFLTSVNEYCSILCVSHLWISFAFGRTIFLSQTLTVTFLDLFTSRPATMFWIRGIILHVINGSFFIPSVPFLVSFPPFSQPLPLLSTHPSALSLRNIQSFFQLNHLRKKINVYLRWSTSPSKFTTSVITFFFDVLFSVKHHFSSLYNFFTILLWHLYPSLVSPTSTYIYH